MESRSAGVVEDDDPGLFIMIDPGGRLAHELRAAVEHAVRLQPKTVAESPPFSHRPSLHERRRLSDLTRREREILALVARQRSNCEIARQLWISQDTVRFHLRNAYRKLGVHNRRAAVALAEEQGLLGPEASRKAPLGM
jgi:DNA-binding CsgD family transcriptional regulator